MKQIQLLVITFLSILPVSLSAQTEMKERTLDEIVVSGLAKSTQSIEDQGVSYTILDSALLEKNNVRDLQDLAKYVPALEIPQYGSRLTSSMYIRGIGSRVNSPSVGVYYESVPLLFKSGMNRHYYDIDKMAVLRGPQGTLYGLNTEGGLMIIEGQNPLDAVRHGAPRFKAHMGVENHGGRIVEGGFTFPLIDNVAASVQAFYRGSHGYQWNTNLKRRADDIEEGGGKVRLAWNPSEKLHLSLFSDIQRVEQRGFAYGLLAQGGLDGEYIIPDSISSPSTNYIGRYYRTTFDAGLNLAYYTGKWRLQSTTSFQYLNDNMEMDQDYTVANLMHLTQHQRGKAITEELNLKGNLSGKWRISNGVYAAQKWLTAFSPVYFDKDFTANIGQTIRNAMAAAMPPAMASALSVGVEMKNPGEYRTPMTNLGVFHESSFNLAKDFTATLGLRYDFNRQELKYSTSSVTDVMIKVLATESPRNVTSAYSDNLHKTSHMILPKASLKFRDWYVSASEGYRAGGFNFQMFSDILQAELMQTMQSRLPEIRQGDITIEHDAAAYAQVTDRIGYDPEISWNFEFGGNHSFGDNRSSAVNLRYSAFYSKVKDLQLSVMATEYGYGRMMKNAGESTSFGGEVNVSGFTQISDKTYKSNLPSCFDTKLLPGRLTWLLSYSFTHSDFLEDKHVPFIPQHTVNANFGYEWNRYSVQLNMLGRGKIYWDEENTLAQPFYTQFGVRATADFGILKASLWANNLLNYQPTTFAFTNTSGKSTMVIAQKGEPFMMGASLDVRF